MSTACSAPRLCERSPGVSMLLRSAWDDALGKRTRPQGRSARQALCSSRPLVLRSMRSGSSRRVLPGSCAARHRSGRRPVAQQPVGVPQRDLSCRVRLTTTSNSSPSVRIFVRQPVIPRVRKVMPFPSGANVQSRRAVRSSVRYSISRSVLVSRASMRASLTRWRSSSARRRLAL